MSLFFRDKQKKVDELNEKFKHCFNTLSIFRNDEVIIFLEFKIIDDDIQVCFRRVTTPDGQYSYRSYSSLKMYYGDNFISDSRNKFLRLNHELKILGFEIKKIETNE